MENINSISPDLRDNLLNKNIGKYNQIDEVMIYPIGHAYDIYTNVGVKKESLIPNGLLDYINNITTFEKKGEFEENIDVLSLSKRDKISIDVGYNSTQLKQYSYLEDEMYHEPKDKNWVSMGVDAALGYVLGDSVAITSNNNGVEIVSSSLDLSTSIPGRLADLALGNESNLGKIGLLSLGTALANSTIQRTRVSEEMTALFAKPIGFYDAVDTLEFDKMGISQLPENISNFSKNMLPIYFYTEVKKSDVKEYSWLNEGEININGEEITYQNNYMANESGTPMPVDSTTFSPQSLLYKTQKLFSNGRIQTLVSRLGANKIDGDTSVTVDNPISKGRGLKTRDGKYLRGWTASNSYNKISSLITPFNSDESKNNLNDNLKRVRPNADSSGSLEKYGVLQDDGFVKIAPYANDANFGKFQKSDVKKYMFSIENLAWMDSIDSLIEGTSQEGPNGGRIMWFPPYDINFNETTSVNWNSDTFIGRGEPVYTYVNTERNGTLSFKLIVDHPSIINYYKQAKTGADGQPITDDDYLRFFAGDTVLKLPDEIIPEEGKKEPEQNILSENKPKVNTFKIYFPNNYSGINDGYKDALQYLYQGHACSSDIVSGQVQGYENEVGAWKGLTNIGEDPCYETYWYRVDTIQNVTETQRKDTASFGLNNSKESEPNSYSFREVYTLINSPSTPNTESEASKTARNNYITEYINNAGLKIDMDEKSVDYLVALENNDTTGITYYKGIYDSAISAYTGSTETLTALEETNDSVNKNGLFYTPITLVDLDKNSGGSYADSELSNLKNAWNTYVNSKSILDEALNDYNDIQVQYYYTGNTGDTTYTDVEVKEIIYNDSVISYNTKKTNLETLLNTYTISESPITYNDFYKMLLDAQEIIIEGSASKQGVETQNTVLANNRAKIVKDWLMSINANAGVYKTKSVISQSDVNPSKDTSSKEAKIDRFARVTISNKAAVVEAEGVSTNTTNSTSQTIEATGDTDNTSTSLRVKKSFYGYYNDKRGTSVRNDEAQFFEKIGNSKEQSIIFDKLSEKIKYFSPAFHSMTPEGFNTRLTFLHQCTRQGSTKEATTTNGNQKTATNMAFGRPPICILRIGDFYNTKIVVDSMNIDFDPLVWDLNQEGIGVQPMIANVTLNFKFIGGSDLTGPIARLQNAVTFNFFANTGVYDDRNDRIVPVDEKDKSKGMKYDPLYNPHVYDSESKTSTSAYGAELNTNDINNLVNIVTNTTR